MNNRLRYVWRDEVIRETEGARITCKVKVLQEREWEQGSVIGADGMPCGHTVDWSDWRDVPTVSEDQNEPL